MINLETIDKMRIDLASRTYKLDGNLVVSFLTKKMDVARNKMAQAQATAADAREKLSQAEDDIKLWEAEIEKYASVFENIEAIWQQCQVEPPNEGSRVHRLSEGPSATAFVIQNEKLHMSELPMKFSAAVIEIALAEIRRNVRVTTPFIAEILKRHGRDAVEGKTSLASKISGVLSHDKRFRSHRRMWELA